MTFKDKQVAIITLVANDEIRNYIIGLCEKNNYHPVMATDLEELLGKTKRARSAIVLVDYEIIESYGARIYSRINVACPRCEVILLCDQPHRDLIKEAMELGVYACILAPYEEWEVVTMIRNILTVKKKRRLKKSGQSPVI